MPARKRTRRDVEAEDREMAAAIEESTRLFKSKQGNGADDVHMKDVKEPSKLDRLRNMWEFASLVQYLGIFGKAIRLDGDITIEVLEAECLKPEPSEKLMEIGLAMLKCVSSHRGLTPEIFDEYTRRQYLAKSKGPHPFGEEEEPAKFDEFDTFTKIRVLRQLAVWTLNNPDRVRDRMYETEMEQTEWRLESIGEDAQYREYYLSNDDRLYRLTHAKPPVPETPAWKPKANTKKAKAAARAARRAAAVEPKQESEDPQDGPSENQPDEDNGLDGSKWECLAVSLDEFRVILEQFRRSRNANEKGLYANLAETVLPVIEKADEKRQQEEAKKQKELLALEMIANAKRSSRIAGKLEREKQEQEQKEADEKKRQEAFAQRKEQAEQYKLERARENRILNREQRIQEREQRRIENEAALETLSKDGLDGNERKSARYLKSEIERIKNALEETTTEDWFFDCSGCGVFGENLDDGTHSVACDKCSVWQHSACLGISKEDAEREDFHFICKRCRQVEADAKRAADSPKLTIKIRLNNNNNNTDNQQNQQRKSKAKDHKLPSAANGAENTTPPKVFQEQRSAPPQQQVWQQHIANGQSPSYPQPPATFEWKVPQSPNTMLAKHSPTPVSARPSSQAAPTTSHSSNWSSQATALPSIQSFSPGYGQHNGQNSGINSSYTYASQQGSNGVHPPPYSRPEAVSPRPFNPPAPRHSPYLQQSTTASPGYPNPKGLSNAAVQSPSRDLVSRTDVPPLAPSQPAYLRAPLQPDSRSSKNGLAAQEGYSSSSTHYNRHAEAAAPRGQSSWIPPSVEAPARDQPPRSPSQTRIPHAQAHVLNVGAQRTVSEPSDPRLTPGPGYGHTPVTASIPVKASAPDQSPAHFASRGPPSTHLQPERKLSNVATNTLFSLAQPSATPSKDGYPPSAASSSLSPSRAALSGLLNSESVTPALSPASGHGQERDRFEPPR